jgi:hypothetical protein
LADLVRIYIRYVERVNRLVGLFAMYLVFAMVGVLLGGTVFTVLASLDQGADLPQLQLAVRRAAGECEGRDGGDDQSAHLMTSHAASLSA